MKKRKVVINNLVAKHAAEFNKATVHRDRTKYQRNEKHRKSDAFSFM
jgi:hypothetical protein